MPLPPLGLYIHLPWCARKCPYCDFNSHEAAEIPEVAYVNALLDDLRQEYAGENREIATAFIGGGTPSLFSAEAVEKLLEGVRQITPLAPDVEITLEANPGSSDSQRYDGYRRAGVTRLSIGVQSFQDKALGRLGRIHNARGARDAVQAAKVAGFTSFNIDLMHGLPEQTPGDGLGDIDSALALQPPHLSWYQLTIERNTQFYTSRPLLPCEDDLDTLEQEGIRRLEDAGYQRYEVSAWARPGWECRHNLNYWRFGDYIAIGAGAHGKLTKSDGRIVRYAKTRLPADYLDKQGRRRRAERELDPGEKRSEFLLNALRLRDGFSLSEFENRTGLSATDLEPELSTLRAEGLLEMTGEQFRCSEIGWRFLDSVVARFL